MRKADNRPHGRYPIAPPPIPRHRRRPGRRGSGCPTAGRAGANDRIGIGLVGCGSRGTYLLDQALAAAPGQIQLVGLCDVWNLAREKMAASMTPKLPGQKPKLVARHQDLPERCPASTP